VLFDDEMALVCNHKPVIGDVEMKIEKKPKNFLYISVLLFKDRAGKRTLIH